MRFRYGLVGLAAVAAMVIGLAGNAVAATERTDWSLLATYAPNDTTCNLRFSVPKNSFTLSVVLKPKKGDRKPEARFVLAGLPPYLDGKRGFIRDVRLSLDSLVFTEIKATWTKGDKANNSRLVFLVPSTDVVPALATSRKVSIDFGLSTGVRSFPIDMAGSAGPAKLLAACGTPPSK